MKSSGAMDPAMHCALIILIFIFFIDNDAPVKGDGRYSPLAVGQQKCGFLQSGGAWKRSCPAWVWASHGGDSSDVCSWHHQPREYSTIHLLRPQPASSVGGNITTGLLLTSILYCLKLWDLKAITYSQETPKYLIKNTVKTIILRNIRI